MTCRLLFEVLLLVSFCWTTIIAAVTPGLLPQDKCGITSATDTSKVVLHEYPWIAALKYKTGEESKVKIRCTGTLIHKRYILTAAHCFQTSLVGVTLGGTEKGAPPLQEFSISIKDVIVHPDFKRAANDIALIRLPNDADDSTNPVCLPIQDGAKNNQFVHNLTVAGWFSYYGKPNPELEKVSVPVVSNAKCAEKFKERRSTYNINEKLLCAGDATSADACAQNGGSPLTDQVDLDGIIRTVQYGLVSFGAGGCDDQSKEVPRVYTKISAYTDWILENIKA